MWDVVVVGARCAGATTALRFARSGRSVRLLDRAPAGSDTLSTHVLVPPAIARLDDLSLLDTVHATGAPPVHSILWEFEGERHPRPIKSQHGYLLCVRRAALDPLLVGAAARAGVTVRHGATVEDLVWEDGRVAGIRLRAALDGSSEERARMVVGADGRHSIVARLAAEPEYNTVNSESGAIYAYFRGVGPSAAGPDVLQFASGPGCDALCCPCDGDLHVVLLIVSANEFATLSGQGAEAYVARLRTIPPLAARLDMAERVSTLYRASPRELRGFFRRPFGPGWALVGDAGYHAHPAPANGIADALRAAELVHAGVEHAWTAGQPAEAYLAEYQQIRDDESAESYHASFRLGQINPFKDPELAAAVLGH